MLEPQITVIIPTYNRYECIRKLVDECIAVYQGKLFKFEIHDSSDDTTCETYVKPLASVKYFKYDSSINGDIKTINAMRNADTPYVYLLGDSFLIDFNKLENIISSSDIQNCLIIGVMRVNSYKKYQKRLKDYTFEKGVYSTNDHQKFFYDFFWYLTLYGGSIIRKDLCEENECTKKLMTMQSPFVYVCTIFTMLGMLSGGKKCEFILLDNVMQINPLKGKSGWWVNKKAIEIFCYRYYESVRYLSDIYNTQNRKFLISHNKYSGLFSFKSVILLRIYGNITFSILKKYRQYINKTVPVKNIIYIWVSLLLPRGILNLIYRIKKRKEI